MVREFPQIDWEKIEKGIEDPVDDPEFDAHVKKVAYNAMPITEYVLQRANADRLIAEYINGKLNQKQYEAAIGQIEFPTIQVETLEEYRHALALVLGDNHDGVLGILVHENAHMGKLLELGLKGYYQFDVARDEDGDLHVYPMVKVVFPEQMPEDEQRKLTKEIAEAPDELSSVDKFHLGIKEE